LLDLFHRTRIPDIASDAPPQPRSHDIRSMADPGSPAPAHRAPGAGGDRIRCTQTPCEQACAAPTVSVSSPLRPVRAIHQVPRPRQNRRPFFVRQLPSVPKNAISLNHRHLKVFTNSRGEPLLLIGVHLRSSAAISFLPFLAAPLRRQTAATYSGFRVSPRAGPLHSASVNFHPPPSAW